jgi:hypothetical protein
MFCKVRNFFAYSGLNRKSGILGLPSGIKYFPLRQFYFLTGSEQVTKDDKIALQLKKCYLSIVVP